MIIKLLLSNQSLHAGSCSMPLPLNPAAPQISSHHLIVVILFSALCLGLLVYAYDRYRFGRKGD